jgi:predicted CDP-diglyceride synthetase/phosphatidate cytidylyltransferase
MSFRPDLELLLAIAGAAALLVTATLAGLLPAAGPRRPGARHPENLNARIRAWG